MKKKVLNLTSFYKRFNYVCTHWFYISFRIVQDHCSSFSQLYEICCMFKNYNNKFYVCFGQTVIITTYNKEKTLFLCKNLLLNNRLCIIYINKTYCLFSYIIKKISAFKFSLKRYIAFIFIICVRTFCCYFVVKIQNAPGYFRIFNRIKSGL